jgi:thiol-disulfide isomerase/thioredoxin
MTVLKLHKSENLTTKNINLLKKMLKENTVFFVYSNSCGHCIDFKPEWEKFKTRNKINIVEIESDALIEINKSYKSIFKKVCPSNGLVYFPMIVLLNNNSNKTKKYIYEGERKSKIIKKYVEDKLKDSSEYIDVDKLNSSFNELIKKIANARLK